jgi:hypothetical protein
MTIKALIGDAVELICRAVYKDSALLVQSKMGKGSGKPQQGAALFLPRLPQYEPVTLAMSGGEFIEVFSEPPANKP